MSTPRTNEYAVVIEQIEPGEFEARLPDLPDALAFGATPEEALAQAQQALDALFDVCWADSEPFPDPVATPAPGRAVRLSLDRAARLALAREMERRSLSKVAVAAAAGVDEKVVRRVLSGRAARLEQTLRLLDSLGARPLFAA